MGSLLNPIPVAGPYLSLAAFAMMLLASWIALREGLGRRWKPAVLIPLLGFLAFHTSVALVTAMVGGIDLTKTALIMGH